VASQPNPTPTRPLSTAEVDLIARIRAGDESAFEALHSSYHHALWRFAHNQVRTPQGAEDIVQDVFLALWRNRAGWEVTTSIAGWLYGAVRHHALRYLQRERTVVRLAERAVVHAAGGATSAEVADVAMGATMPDAHEAVVARELDDAVAQALAALPERRRIAMTLRWKHQLSAPEIAAVLGTTPEAVRVLLTRARQELSALLAYGRE
jgi:RNA polymerase sigma-70 factor, ECF subfamily